MFNSFETVDNGEPGFSRKYMLTSSKIRSSSCMHPGHIGKPAINENTLLQRLLFINSAIPRSPFGNYGDIVFIRYHQIIKINDILSI